jgi:nicotinate-nucleotide pyrophosphorylase (carboxylating)
MPLNSQLVKKIVRAALEEDKVFGDITTQDFVPSDVRVEARMIAKEEGVVCGAALAAKVFKTFDPGLRVVIHRRDGQNVARHATVMTIKGRGRSVLSAERVALNFISYLSGISTQTKLAVDRVRGAGIRILDTRKTTPLLRTLEKYAVLMGQGKNHRLDLSDQYLVKDNHVFILRQTSGMEVLSWRRRRVPFEIEVENFDELNKALAFLPDIIMLDNFSPLQVRQAIKLLARLFPDRKRRPMIELSGGITLDNISRYILRGVDFISLGALTHSARALDFSLEITKVYS